MLAVIIGLPGSGKSTVLRPLVAKVNVSASQIVDADAVRVLFPEYAGGMGSDVVQIETVYVSYGELFNRAVATGSDLIVDTVGRIDHFRQYRNALPGYEVHVLCTELPLEVAVERVKRRAVESGRFVREEVVRSAYGRSRATFDAVVSQQLADEWALIDTSGSPPRVTACSPLYGPAGREL